MQPCNVTRTQNHYRSHAGDTRGSAYLQALATFLEGEYMNLTLDRIYMMVKQYMITVSQVSLVYMMSILKGFVQLKN